MGSRSASQLIRWKISPVKGESRTKAASQNSRISTFLIGNGVMFVLAMWLGNRELET